MTAAVTSVEAPRDGAVLDISGLVRHFTGPAGTVKAVDGVSLSIGRGEIVGLVGESGSGKSTVGRCAVRLDRPTAGSVTINGREVTRLSKRALRPLRKDFHLVFQDPSSSLDPRMTVGAIVAQPLRLHRLASGDALRDRVAALLAQVGLRPELARRRPHELSGGQRHLGQLVEQAPAAELFADPKHPYTQALLSAAPVPDPAAQRSRARIVLSGELPSPLDPPPGCRFHTRCPLAVDRCRTEPPALRGLAGGGGRQVSCHLVADDGTAPDASAP
ncbi:MULTISPECIES: oligopeptide/dipeptide ABC transporter ATP-binding protein [Streptomyces]|uniref:oligopeptide/dipeptide ABC transporter ATP-binding protein n=1 Tax=Streptomyces TaxID=1883 RepID=UPI000F7862DB|nr:oligopeptide/dipeptide ABC transporter ATP-binding protein [Streptomyces sp. WAC05858]RSS33049.1 ATP-binding cassette domain-containing protein [Streptomyces sp. WAC05858]